MPRITTGNTMAPCVVIGERAADMILAAHDTQLAAGIKQQRPDPS
jgi:choline dehydrogenase